MNKDFELKLSNSLDYLEQGETLESVLSRFPEDADVLRPFLEVTTALSGLSSQPTVAAKQKSQAAFLSHAQTLQGDSRQPAPIF